ncbi:MAG: HAD-IIIA family hydrolase [Bacteroidota bacterium]
MPSYKEKLPSIRAFIFDVDGVFTDSTVYLHPSGEMLRAMNTRDGYAVRVAVDRGYTIGIITGGNSPSVKSRLEGLGVKQVFLGIHEKMDTLLEFMRSNNLSPDECMYMGDDIPDYEVMLKVGFAAAPQDACQEIKSIAHYISPYDGGRGCVRDIIEQTLRVQNNWFDVTIPSN